MNYKHLLFIIFSLLTIFFVLWNSKSKLVEPLENQGSSQSNCCENNPAFLAMKNASEISILKDQVKEINDLKKKIGTLETETQTNTKYIDELQKEFLDEGQTMADSMDTGDETDVQPELSETFFSPQEQGMPEE
jgi:peptidoglycan hydrolase CwlO-like protein